MIEFGYPIIKNEGNVSRLIADVTIDNRKDSIWFEVNSEYQSYLCTERCDAYVIAVLNYAMRNHHDIKCSAPITEELLFNLDKYLIDALANANPHFYRTRIYAPVASETLPSAGAVGTGISCGVDSLQVLSSYSETKYKSHQITHLTFNNVGSHGDGKEARELFEKRKRRSIQFAKDYGYKIVVSDSNLHEVINQNHFLSHTYSSLFPVYCLQKLYSTFYYASASIKYNEFSLIDIPQHCSGTYEFISLPYFSTRNIRIYSGGEGLTRLEKLKEISTYKPSYKYLNVCLKENTNCGKCEKCVRTMLALDAIDKIEEYKEVFDVDYYKRNKQWYFAEMLFWLHQGKHDYFEIYDKLKGQISLKTRLKQYASYGLKSFIYMSGHFFYYKYVLRKDYF